MGMTTVRRREEKQAKRRKVQARKAAAAASRAEADLQVEPGGAPAELAEALRRSARQVRQEHAAIFGPAARAVLRRIRRDGFEGCLAGIRDPGGPDRATLATLDRAIDDLVDALAARLPEEVARRHGPYHRLTLARDARDAGAIRLRLEALRAIATPHGTAYGSPCRPHVVLGGGRWEVAFSRHAVERVAERASAAVGAAAGFTQAATLLHCCTYFEDATEALGEPAFTIYAPLGMYHPRSPRLEAPRPEFLPEGAGPDHLPALRVGYCPVAIHGRVAVARTLLLPGMRGTPEHAALRASRLPRAEKG